MQRIRCLVKKAFTPITIMIIPHSNARHFRIKIPSVGFFASAILWAVGTIYVFSVAVDVMEYQRMKDRMNYYSGQFSELKTTILSLKKAEYEFKRIFSISSKEKILENLDTSDSGSIDMETVGEIRDYLSQQRDIYLSTPKGWPVDGHITSQYGKRQHPRSGEDEFHSGIDIAAEPGMPVKATADGIISFAGWSGGSGNLVVIEHGFGFSTFYAHNKMVAVRIGQKIRRGEVLGYIGSTGNSTGPHVHYEVWQAGSPANPNKYLAGRT